MSTRPGWIGRAILVATAMPGIAAAVPGAATTRPVVAKQNPAAKPTPKLTESSVDPPLPDAPVFKDAGSNIKFMSKNIWIDANPKGRRTLVRAVVCLQQGTLEHLMCRKGTKEHEAIIAADIDAQHLHAALLFTGAKPGGVMRYEQDVFQPAFGDEIDVQIAWKDGNADRRARAQEWLRDIRSQKDMPYAWVFAGSRIYKNPVTNADYYMGNDGDLITVVNFHSSVLDLPVKSSQSDSDHIFEAHRERIPPIGTEVFVVLRPAKRPATDASKSNTKLN